MPMYIEMDLINNRNSVLPPTHTSTGALLVDKHLKIVREVTWDARAKWNDLGLELKVSDGTLKVGYIA